MRKLYWKIRYTYERWYFENKYGNRKNKVYYDKRYDCYVCPKLLDERGPVEYVIAELTRTGLIYKYKLNGEWAHDHFFVEVLLNAYNEAEVFEIPQEVEYQYSQQELDMLRKAVEAGKVGEK
ncbi:hypothetical protein [Niameybacter sp.]|uniref:hypothetical protein n=1 Tax=Niameybacter sp. TaxID=2033640 RepID=UPI002FCB65F2